MERIGYIRHSKSASASRQRAALEAEGITRIYVDGYQAENLTEAIRPLRRGDQLVVLHAWLIAEPKRTTRDSPRDSFFDAAKAIAANGATLMELQPRRDTSTDCHDMARDAVRWLSGQARGSAGAVNGAKSRGRPARDWSPWRQVIELEWFDLRHPTNEAALEAMRAKGVPIKSTTTAWRLIKDWTGRGASGRDK